MVTTFEYETRTHCICGTPLEESASSVVVPAVAGSIRFLKCVQCGSWCQSPQLTMGSLQRWFDSQEYQGGKQQRGLIYPNYIEDEPLRRLEACYRYENDLRPLLNERARVLEIGCATGTLLEVLRFHGHVVDGVDLSARFVEFALGTKNLSIRLGDVLSATLETHVYDAVLMFGTIGNLRNLGTYLQRLRQLLVPGGLLIFTFADADSPVVRFIYRSRFWMFTPSVNCFMTSRGCIAALKAQSFEPLCIRRDLQRPGLGKLFSLARIHALAAGLGLLGIDRVALPFRIPIPTIRFVVAKASATTGH